MLKLVIMLQVYFAIYDYFFLLSLAYMKKSLYLCSANPRWGSASGGAVVRSAANKSISSDIFECPGAQASSPADKLDTIRLSGSNTFVDINSVGKQTC